MVHLHTHSMYSLRDSIIRPEDLIARLQEIGQTAVAITDHGGSLGGVSMYQKLKKAGIKYIHGCEFYICDDTKIRDKDRPYYHLVALCKNEAGRVNLNRLISLSERPENRYYKPRIDFDLLSQYGDGLILLSACLAGEIARRFSAGEDDAARAIAQKYRDRFGEDYYLEVQSHMDQEQILVNRKILALGDELAIPCVVTTDAHYTWERDKQYQSKYAFRGAYKEDGETYLDCFVQSEEEVRARLAYLPPATVDALIARTHEIADRCCVEMPLSAPIMPEVTMPEDCRGWYCNNTEYLWALCADGMRRKLNIHYCAHELVDPDRPGFQHTQEKIKEYCDRLRYEMDALTRMGFVDYILLVYSYANKGSRRGIARGSGGGSLVNYILNITDIDPIEYGLYFERFIDVGALSKLDAGEITAKELKVPDIDLDFSGESCEEVLQFLYDTYGENRVASIGKFGTNKTKGTIRDMCKVLDIDLATADQIAKSFENYEIDEIDYMISGALERSPGAEEAIANVERYPELFDYVRKLNGLPKSFGLHACGKIVATRPLDEFLPSCYDSNGVRYLQGDMHDVEDVGLVKIDVLGLRTLDAEYDTLEQSHETPAFLDPKQGYSDPKVLDIFRTGDTLGVFQMSSPGMRQTLKKMHVSGIEDISVANALFRPGSIQYIDNYCRRKTGQESFSYLHPDLEPILKNTYGIIVYQEQLIEIGRMAGLRNPDQLRKATGKKNPALLAEVKPELEEKLLARGWTQAQFDQLWSDMLEFAKYSFNKCVSGDTRLRSNTECVTHTVAEMWRDMQEHPTTAKFHALSMRQDGSVYPNQIVSITKSGVKKTWHVVMRSGASVVCTYWHKFPTERGDRPLWDLQVGDRLYVARNQSPGVLEPIVSIKYMGTQMTYDIEMADPCHNFVTDSGLVTCNSHSCAYAILSYMTAKQKAYYPVEFYCGLCNSYMGKSEFVKDDAPDILNDMYRHNVRVAPMSFRDDHRRCTARDGRVLWAIPLIRDCSAGLADAVYALRDTSEVHFWRLLRELKDQGFEAMTQILIRLGFFSEYGAPRQLLRVQELSRKFKYGQRKTLRAEEVESSEFLASVVGQYGARSGTAENPGKRWNLTDCPAILDACEDYIRSLDLGGMDPKAEADFQIEYLGGVALPSNREEDRNLLLVRRVFPVHRKRDNALFAYNILYVSLGSGISNAMTVWKSRFDRDPIHEGDVILCKRWERDGKYFRLLDYTRVQ